MSTMDRLNNKKIILFSWLIIKIKYLFFLFLFLRIIVECCSAQPTASGNTYYMSTSGSNSNDGSINSPWATLQYAQTQLNPGDILYAEAAQGRTVLITKDSQLSSQFTLNELEERLKRSGFFRAHRSYLVNLQHVQDVIPYSRNSFSLRLSDPDNTKIPLSKNAEVELRDLLNY